VTLRTCGLAERIGNLSSCVYPSQMMGPSQPKEVRRPDFKGARFSGPRLTSGYSGAALELNPNSKPCADPTAGIPEFIVRWANNLE
jgi:hypothetical protein